jgi:hypothetical protein
MRRRFSLNKRGEKLWKIRLETAGIDIGPAILQ